MMDNNVSFSYLPKRFRDKQMYYRPDSDLVYARFLPDVWNTPTLPLWDKIESVEDRKSIIQRAESYYYENINPVFELKVKNNPSISSANKLLIEELMENYYLRCMTPTLHGLYIDGRGLLDQLSQLDNNSIQKTATRYFDLMSAVTIFGVISANNTKRNGALQQDAQRAKKLVMDIYSLPMSSSYSATSKHTEHARTLGIPEKPYTLPVAQIKTEITRGLGLDDAGKITLAEDMTGAPKAQYRNESRVVSNDTTQWAVWWLNEMVYELKDVQDIEQSRGTSRVLNSAKK